MAITNLDGYIAANKQIIGIQRASITSVANIPTQILQAAGNPGAGVLAGTSTANGVVPDDGTAGFPPIDTFVGTGYLTRVQYSGVSTGRLFLFDCLFKAGAYAFNANTTLSAQPSYATRIPGADYKNTQIWIEAVTAFTGNQTITVTYTNQSGVTGRTTGAIATGVAPIVGRMLQLPLAAGDSGVQKIERVVSSGSTVGTFNVLVLRPLWSAPVLLSSAGGSDDMLTTGMPVLFDTSALMLIVQPTGTSTGVVNVQLEIANG